MNSGDLRALAADGVVLVDDRVVLIERNHQPYEGHWVLPGGMVERDETARQACAREVEEEIGLDVDSEASVGLYDEPSEAHCASEREQGGTTREQTATSAGTSARRTCVDSTTRPPTMPSQNRERKRLASRRSRSKTCPRWVRPPRNRGGRDERAIWRRTVGGRANEVSEPADLR